MKAFGNEKGLTNILIPLLQRDYVQGGVESVISPFLDQLLSGIEVDLNYIYGYEEDGCFIPIDGQQRLITLWLLHLYISSRENVNVSFTVDLSFKGREFANDFCEAIKKHLQEAMPSVEESGELSDVLKDQSWFMTSWLTSLTVRCMLKTLDYIHRLYKPNCGCTWQMLTAEDCKITFSFLKMDGKDGLDDDIYIKMNGRGRALSDFENLKSWMDEHVCFEEDNDRKAEWKSNMDNKWTDFFWKNRNLHQEHPEEIDDEQLFCFCNLLILYWMRNQEKLQKNIDGLDKFEKEELISLLAKINESSGNNAKDLLSKIYDYLREGNMFPLVWIERLTLMDNEFFTFAMKALNILSDLSDTINDFQKKEDNKHCLYFDEEDDCKIMYHIALRKGTYGKTLPMLFAIISLCNVSLSSEEIYQRLRVIRNLILNTSIVQKDLQGKILAGIHTLSAKLNNETKILQFLNSESDSQTYGFEEKQFNEERVKAKYADTELMEDIEDMENSSFFRGKIICMFNFLIYTGYDSWSEENFKSYKKVLMTLFPNKDGVDKVLDDKEHILRRALINMPIIDDTMYGFKYKKDYWSFCASSDDWRSLLSERKENGIGQVQMLIKKIISLDIVINKESILKLLQEIVNEASSKYHRMIFESTNGVKDWMYFVCYPKIWDDMESKLISWNSNYDIIVWKKCTTSRSDRMDIRTYALYLDIQNGDISSDFAKEIENWNFNIWPKEDTCFYFDIDCSIEDIPNVTKIAIDVYHNKTKEDDYVYNLFVRTKEGFSEGEVEAEVDLNRDVFLNHGFKPIIEELGLTQECCECYWIKDPKPERSIRFIPKKTFSRVGMMEVLAKLLPEVRNICKQLCD